MGIQIAEKNEIASVFSFVKVHNLLFRPTRKSLAELLSNNGFNKDIVLPEKQWQKSLAFYDNTFVPSLEINGSVIDPGDLWPMVGGPLASLNWL